MDADEKYERVNGREYISLQIAHPMPQKFECKGDFAVGDIWLFDGSPTNEQMISAGWIPDPFDPIGYCYDSGYYMSGGVPCKVWVEIDRDYLKRVDLYRRLVAMAYDRSHDVAEENDPGGDTLDERWVRVGRYILERFERYYVDNTYIR